MPGEMQVAAADEHGFDFNAAGECLMDSFGDCAETACQGQLSNQARP